MLPKKCNNQKFSIIMELLQIAERAFVHKLKRKNPNLSDLEVKEAIKTWYMDRPGAEYGDGVGIVGDPKRFD
jgi:hypothetical protein